MNEISQRKAPPPPQLPFWTIVDIGARYGINPKLSELFDSVLSNYYAFEADAAECTRLLNQYASAANYRVYPVALSNVITTRKLFIKSNGGLSSLHRQVSESMWFRPDETLPAIQAELEVATTRLDTFVSAEGIHPPDFLKLDVEGHELEVLEGAGSLLTTTLAIFVELNFHQTYQCGSRAAAVMDFLERSGFVIANLDYDQKGRPQSYLCPPDSSYGILVGCDAIFINKRLWNSDASLEVLLKFTAASALIKVPDLMPQFIRKCQEVDNKSVRNTSRWLNRWRSVAWEVIKIRFLQSTYALRLGPPSLFEAAKKDYSEFFCEVYPESDKAWTIINQGTRGLFN